MCDELEQREQGAERGGRRGRGRRGPPTAQREVVSGRGCPTERGLVVPGFCEEGAMRYAGKIPCAIAQCTVAGGRVQGVAAAAARQDSRRDTPPREAQGRPDAQPAPAVSRPQSLAALHAPSHSTHVPPRRCPPNGPPPSPGGSPPPPPPPPPTCTASATHHAAIGDPLPVALSRLACRRLDPPSQPPPISTRSIHAAPAGGALPEAACAVGRTARRRSHRTCLARSPWLPLPPLSPGRLSNVAVGLAASLSGRAHLPSRCHSAVSQAPRPSRLSSS